MAKKRKCRYTAQELAIHEEAVRLRKMTDAQLCEYLDGLNVGQRPAGTDKAEVVNELLEALSVRTDDGLRISDATIRKIRDIATRRGFLPSAE